MALLRHRFELPLLHALRQWFVLTFRGTRLSGFSTLAPNSQLLAQPIVSGSPTNHPSLVPPWLRANSTGALLLAFCALSLSRTPRTYLRLQYALVMWRLTTDALLLTSRQEAMSKIAPAAATAIHRSEGQLARAHGHVLGWLLRAGAGSLATKALLRSWRKWSFYVDTAIDKEVTGSSTTTGTPIPASAVAAAHHPAKQKRGTPNSKRGDRKPPPPPPGSPPTSTSPETEPTPHSTLQMSHSAAGSIASTPTPGQFVSQFSAATKAYLPPFVPMLEGGGGRGEMMARHGGGGAMEVKAREALRSARSSSSPPGSRSVRRTQQSQLVTATGTVLTPFEAGVALAEAQAEVKELRARLVESEASSGRRERFAAVVEAKEAVDVAARSASTAADELTVLLEHAMVAADEGRNAASMLRLDRSRLEAELSAVRQTLKETKHTLLAELATAKEAAERELSMTTGTSFAGFSGRELRGLEEELAAERLKSLSAQQKAESAERACAAAIAELTSLRQQYGLEGTPLMTIDPRMRQHGANLINNAGEVLIAQAEATRQSYSQHAQEAKQWSPQTAAAMDRIVKDDALLEEAEQALGYAARWVGDASEGGSVKAKAAQFERRASRESDAPTSSEEEPQRAGPVVPVVSSVYPGALDTSPSFESSYVDVSAGEHRKSRHAALLAAVQGTVLADLLAMAREAFLLWYLYATEEAATPKPPSPPREEKRPPPPPPQQQQAASSSRPVRDRDLPRVEPPAPAEPKAQKKSWPWQKSNQKL